MSLAPMEELFRHRVFRMLMKKDLLNAERVIRANFSGEKITYNANEGTVIYKTKRTELFPAKGYRKLFGFSRPISPVAALLVFVGLFSVTTP